MARRPQRPRRTARPRRESARTTVERGDLVDAALALAAEMPWRNVTLAEIAARAGTDLATLHGMFPSKSAILGAFVDRIDAAMLAGAAPEAAEEPVRDRLIDALLRRIEALTPYKPGIASIARDTVCAPNLALCTGGRLCRSMAWTLEHAGAGPRGLIGLLRVEALAAIYASTLLVWLRGDDPDLARTMAHLDRRLTQAERLSALCGRFAAPRRAASR